ncbi:MAG: hypothetical protein CM1200mP10_25710 [Candidatus Neomarinimicrobiota bacterium]|nr:MAG: hypothetical protein CM1200mP10_25710 [Candidatus Neomarinimicrobiota bacterium]
MYITAKMFQIPIIGWKMTCPQKQAPGFNAQNKVTFEYLNKIPFRNRLKDRIKSLYDYERISAPFKEGIMSISTAIPA